MSNRTTVKSNIVTKCVPTVSNADMIDMLNTEMNDNLKFREDVAVAQAAATNNITVDFTGRDRVDLTRTGGALNITVSNIGDGEVKYLKIIKTSAQNITWVGVTDVTPCKPTAMLASTILYEIVRKGSNYWCRAFIESVAQASDSYLGVSSPASASENNALLNLSKYVTPGRLPNARTTQTGISRIATQAENNAGTDIDGNGKQLVVQPSELLRKIADLALTTPAAWTYLTKTAGWLGDVGVFIDKLGFLHVRIYNLHKNASLALVGLEFDYVVQYADIPQLVTLSYNLDFAVHSKTASAICSNTLSFGPGGTTRPGISLSAGPDYYTANAVINAYFMFRLI